MEAKKESAPPAKPMEKPNPVLPQQPKAEVAPKSKMEASPKAEPKPVPLDLNALRLQFAFDDYTLSTLAKKNLEKISAWMKENPNAKIQIQGNTCNIGTEEYNLALGDRRAYSPKEFMVALGIDPSRLTTISYGEEKPRGPNIDESNRSLNRRDDFVVVP
jgi:peptidoglycan-associated lipoprotein